MQKIVPNLWFDANAEEAVNFYVSLFPDARIGTKLYYDAASAAASNMPAGSLLTIAFELAGIEFVGLNGGPMFSFTPANSFTIQCRTDDDVESLFAQLSSDGAVLMPLQEYPFSKKFGWVADRYGLSWQIILRDEPFSQMIVPSLLFVGEQFGKAEDAIKVYTTLFPDSSVDQIARYEAGDEDKVGAVKDAHFTLAGQLWRASESSLNHQFTFTEAVSYMVYCDSQDEIERYAAVLSAHPEAEQCGWVKDAFGVSWQLVPRMLEDMLADPDRVRAGRVMRAMLQMKRLDIAALQRAYDEA